IDSDLGESGASVLRDGFSKMVADVGLGRVGIVMGLEVSRLARNSRDWQQLLEICALTQTLILDEEGIYNPACFNDRLLLGLKGTISEAELHVIRARMQGGLKAKAKRGELKIRLPVGYVYDIKDRIVLDPDQRVQDTIRMFFSTYKRLMSMAATVREFNKNGLLFPCRMFSGPRKGELVFKKLTLVKAAQVLHNPRYAGAYVYGIRQQKFRGLDQKPSVHIVGREQWQVLIKDAYKGYISWEEYEENLKCLEEHCRYNKAAIPREGPALLQGLAICASCGKKMTVRYHTRRGKKMSPEYICGGKDKIFGVTKCQSIPGDQIDTFISALLLEKMQPEILEVSFAVQQELKSRIDETNKLRFKHVEQARYEMEVAKKRYLAVDPHNRLVADELEADWNRAIQAHRQAQEEYNTNKAKEEVVLSSKQQQEIMSLCSDFPALWCNDALSDKDRKRMVRLIIEDVTLTKADDIVLQIRFKGGALETHRLPLPKNAFEEKKHSPEVIAEIEHLLYDNTDSEVAIKLNFKGMVSGTGKPFDARRILKIRRTYKIPSYYHNLRQRGYVTMGEVCKKFQVERWTVTKWRKAGQIEACLYDDAGRFLYKPASMSYAM
ncbi:MAG TPA: recombinase family protein, partial [Candidatus Brocadiales bacterium]|nr:recombinase family protein [Candidatus Brocadiales bacterium]